MEIYAVGLGLIALAAAAEFWRRHQKAWRELRSAADARALLDLLGGQIRVLRGQLAEGWAAAEENLGPFLAAARGGGRDLAGRLAERALALRDGLPGRVAPFLSPLREQWEAIVERLDILLKRLDQVREELVRTGAAATALAALEALQKDFESIRSRIPGALARAQGVLEAPPDRGAEE